MTSNTYEKLPSAEYDLNEAMKVGEWHWITSRVQTPKQDEPMQLWVHGTPTDLGYYPQEKSSENEAQSQGYRLEFYPIHDGWKRYIDTVAALGIVKTDTETFPAYMTDWPAPEFMGIENDDPAGFIVRYEDDYIDEEVVALWRKPDSR